MVMLDCIEDVTEKTRRSDLDKLSWRCPSLVQAERQAEMIDETGLLSDG